MFCCWNPHICRCVACRPLFRVLCATSSNLGEYSASPSWARAGDIVQLSAFPYPPHRFVRWVVVTTGGQPVGANGANNSTAMFAMPCCDVWVIAEFAF